LQDTVEFDNRPQRYRESASKLQAALDHLSQAQGNKSLAFLLTLGDIIDGYAEDLDKSCRDLHYITSIIDLKLPNLSAYHVIGNHCLGAPREQLMQVSVCLKLALVVKVTVAAS
jgi:hypothetical protein